MKNNIAESKLKDDLLPFRVMAVEFAKRELFARREERDRVPFVPMDEGVMEKAHGVGFFSINLPEDRGGIPRPLAALSVILEELSAVDASMAAVVFSTAAAIEIVNQAVPDTGCDEIYRLLEAASHGLVAFQSSTSPEEIEMPLSRCVNGRMLIDGNLDFLVLGGMAEYAVVPARSTYTDGFTYYLIRLTEEGVAVSEPLLSLGLRACPACDLRLTAVPGLPIGRPGSGENCFRLMRTRLSAPAAAISLGIMQGSFNDALAYARDRYQGGRMIIDWPVMRHMFAEMTLDIENGRALVSQAIMHADGLNSSGLKAVLTAALRVGADACRVTTDGVQALGGNGYMMDYGQEKRMRDARQAQVLLGMVALRKMELLS